MLDAVDFAPSESKSTVKLKPNFQPTRERRDETPRAKIPLRGVQHAQNTWKMTVDTVEYSRKAIVRATVAYLSCTLRITLPAGSALVSFSEDDRGDREEPPPPPPPPVAARLWV